MVLAMAKLNSARIICKSSAFCRYYLVVFTIFIVISVHTVSSGRILFLLPLSSKSHRILFEPMINSLAERGHDVTVLTNEKINRTWSNSSRVEQLVAISSQDLMQGFPDPFENIKNKGNIPSFPFKFVINGCHKAIQSEMFQKVMMDTSPQKKFDLIIVNYFLSNCLDGFIHKSGVPFILVTTTPAPSYISERVGNFLPPSIVPVISFRGYGEAGKMSFWGRVRNFIHFVLGRVYINIIVLPSLEKVYREYLGDDVPGIFEIEERAEMIFMNSHYSMNLPRPLLPDVVEIGGVHCRKPKPIANADLAKFISKSSSPNGFIYFSVGTMIKLNNAPVEFIRTLFDTFAKLPQRVVLKWKTGLNRNFNISNSTLGIPENVWIGDWFSQQDLLGHDNIRLFISHGGLLSMQEAVYHGVPVLGIPFGLDQDINMYNAILQGYAMKLDVRQLNDESFITAIRQMLSDSSYSQNAKQISNAFRQRLALPLDSAVYWTEHVINSTSQKLPHYIQSPARKMNIFQYYSCDILLFLMTVIMTAVYILSLVFRRIFKLVRYLVNNVKRPGFKQNCKEIQKKVQ